MKPKLWELLAEKIAEGKTDIQTAIQLGSIIEEARHEAAMGKWQKRKFEKRLPLSLAALRDTGAGGC